MELNDDTHFAMVLALSKFMVLYKDDNAKAHIEEDMWLHSYDPAANISTNELAFTVIFACLDAVVLETQGGRSATRRSLRVSSMTTCWPSCLRTSSSW